MPLEPVVSWNFSPEADVAGYRIYYSTVSGQYSPSRRVEIPVPCRNWYRMTQLTRWVVNYVVMTAYDTAGNESAFSAEDSEVVSGGLVMK